MLMLMGWADWAAATEREGKVWWLQSTCDAVAGQG